VPDESYDVTATDAGGKASRSTVRAESVEAVVGRLRADGVQVSELSGRRARRLFEPRRCDLDEFAFFNAELASAARRGAPLPGALRALSRDLTGRRVRESLEMVALDVEGGVDLAEALARRGDVFPPGYVALVAAGLKSGDLAGTLLLFSEEARFAARIRHRVAGAVAYPLVVLFAISALLAAVGWFFIPSFAKMFEEFGTQLPAMTRFHLALAPVLRWAPAILAGLTVAFLAAWWILSRGAGGARALGSLVLRIPVVGRLARAVAMTRFTRTLASALRGKVPVPEAISLAGLASGNAAVGAAAGRLRRSVEDGSTVGDGLAEETAVFPSTVVWMLEIGEQRGELGAALEECARLQEERARRIGEFLPFFVAAAVTALAAGLLMEAAFSMLLPLVGLMQSIS
jgi:type IV pilus assembly protein PilC